MRQKKKLPKYDDVIFFSFEEAKHVRDVMMDFLKIEKKEYPDKKNFISILDLEGILYDTDIDYKVASCHELENKLEEGSLIDEDNIKYGWYKRPGIYEVENGNPSAGYIFEEPVLLT